MTGKKVLIGLITGIISNLVGIVLYIFFSSELGISESINDAIQNDYLTKIISLGAILNFLPFFVFLNKNMIFHARGVLLATLVMAIVIAVFKFL